MRPRVQKGVGILTYSAGDPEADFHAENARYEDGRLLFDLKTPENTIRDVEVGVPVEINIDNAVAAAAAALTAGATPEEVKSGLAAFMGAKRRFEFWLRPEGGKTPVLIDDYAHSPNEVLASIRSVRKLYPGKKLSVIFQPHLYTRTRDFAPEFAAALSEADEVIMPEIYPAREEPIPGVDSLLILNDVKSPEKIHCRRKNLLDLVKNRNFEILMTLGAADIDRLLPGIHDILSVRAKS